MTKDQAERLFVEESTMPAVHTEYGMKIYRHMGIINHKKVIRFSCIALDKNAMMDEPNPFANIALDFRDNETGESIITDGNGVPA